MSMNIKIPHVCIFPSIFLICFFSILILQLPGFEVAVGTMSNSTADATNDDLDRIIKDIQMSNSTADATNDDLDRIIKDIQMSNSTADASSENVPHSINNSQSGITSINRSNATST